MEIFMSIVYCHNANRCIDLDYKLDDVVTDRQGNYWYLPSMVNEKKKELKNLFHKDTFDIICEYVGWGLESSAKRKGTYKSENVYARE
jgi:hypothetical protein